MQRQAGIILIFFGRVVQWMNRGGGRGCLGASFSVWLYLWVFGCICESMNACMDAWKEYPLLYLALPLTLSTIGTSHHWMGLVSVSLFLLMYWYETFFQGPRLKFALFGRPYICKNLKNLPYWSAVRLASNFPKCLFHLTNIQWRTQGMVYSMFKVELYLK